MPRLKIAGFLLVGCMLGVAARRTIPDPCNSLCESDLNPEISR